MSENFVCSPAVDVPGNTFQLIAVETFELFRQVFHL